MSNVNQPAFLPQGKTVLITAGVASDYVLVRANRGASKHVRVYNAGTVTAFIEFGDSAPVATIPSPGTAGSNGTPGSIPIAPGSEEVISCPEKFIAAIVASTTASVFFTPGEGL